MGKSTKPSKEHKQFTEVALEIFASTFPRDYPNYYNVNVGEGAGENIFECDRNSVALWRIKKMIELGSEPSEYEFPNEQSINTSLENAKKELIKYGGTFLNGDLHIYRKAKEEQNKYKT